MATDTTHGRKDVYKVAVEIDIDCEELLDAIGLDYTRSEQDDTQNVVWLELDYDGFTDVFEQAPLCMTNEQTLATALLNHELGEYTTKVTAYTPTGDTITFE
jgi:predicted transcriptional regulator